MADIDAGPGIRVRTADDVDVRVVQEGPVRRGVLRATRSTAAASAELRSALDGAGFTIAAEIDLAPRRRGTRALRADRSQAAEIEVTVAPSESALVLIEGAGGVYAWAYATESAAKPSGKRSARRTLAFRLAPAPATMRRGAGPSARRGLILDWIGDKLVDPVRAYVLKFAVNAIVDVAVDFLEGDKPEGLISVAGTDASAWKPGGAVPPLSQDRPAKILLMIHGTFSSTAGGFAHLSLSEQGRDFLARARARYDAILAFDHKTLELDPQTNADAMMDALAAYGLPQGSSIDAIAHSRGGLVYRTFAEQVLARRRPDIQLGKAVFVGCTNGGTHLAEPANWAAMIDLYTNAIMAGTRAALSLAGGGAISPLVSGGIKTLGRFVQMFSEVAITDARVPGLAAMQPGGTTVKGLNEAEGGIERLAVYYAVTSNFVARLEPSRGITKEFAEFVVDRVTNRLFKVANDLVVDADSMVALGTRQARLEAGDILAFGDTDDVYHTIYFAADRVPVRLCEWLGLPPQGVQHQSAAPAPPVEAPQEPTDSKRRAPAGSRRRASGGLESFRGSPRAARPAASRPAPERAPAPQAMCHFAAEMEPSPPLGKQIPLFVTVSREKIEVVEHEASAATDSPIALDTSRKVEIEIIGRKNCKVVGDAKATIDVPDPKRPETLRFVVSGIEKGTSDILVEARQGPRILVSFVLNPVFVAPDRQKLQVSQAASAAPEGPEESAVLRIYEIADGNRVTLRFDLACQNPNISVSESRTLPAGFSRDAYVAENFKEIENAWLGTGRTYERFLRKLQANGTVMANELLPERVRTALWQHRDAIRAIQVVSEEPFIPWELLYVTDPKAGPDGRGFLCEWGLVRWLHNTRWPDRRLALRRDRVRYVIPSYADPQLKLTGAAEEREMLKQVFGQPEQVGAESDAVSDFLKAAENKCDVLHFACHGESAQRAVMRADLLMTGSKVEDGYVTDPLSSDSVKTHARFSSEGSGPIVFINACQTGRGGAGLGAGVAGFVDAFLRPYSERGAGVLVGALWSVDDKLAFTFAKSFYGAIQGKRTLVDSARAAREACKGQGDLTWLAYTIYGNPFARLQ